MVRRSWFVVVAVATVFACLRCLHGQQPAPQSGPPSVGPGAQEPLEVSRDSGPQGGFGAPGRGCTLSLVQQGREAGWMVRLKETEKARLAPLAWPVTRKEAWQACQRFLDGRKESKGRKVEKSKTPLNSSTRHYDWRDSSTLEKARRKKP